VIVRHLALTICALAVSGCAGHWERSFDRWQAMQNSTGPQVHWVKCVDERSDLYLSEEKLAAPPSWYQGQVPAKDQVIFTWVLADCAPKMTGVGFDHLQPEQYERLISDAYRHFFSVRAEIRATEDMKVI
jgi:hypothetical protein